MVSVNKNFLGRHKSGFWVFQTLIILKNASLICYFVSHPTMLRIDNNDMARLANVSCFDNDMHMDA